MQDQWLYLSAAGFVISALLWPFFLVQFRHARLPDGLDFEREDESPVKPLTPAPAPQKTAPAIQPLPAAPAKAAAPSPLPVKTISPEKTPISERTMTEGTKPPTSGEASAGAVFLREMKAQIESVQKDLKNIKEQMLASGQKNESQFDVLVNQLSEIKQTEKEMQDLKKQVLIAVGKHDSQFEAMLNQWNDLKTELHRLGDIGASGNFQPQASPAAAPIPAPAEAAPERVESQETPPESSAPEFELPQTAGVPGAEAAPPRLDFGRDTVIIDPKADAPQPEAAVKPEPEVPPKPALEGKPKRRGPVIIDPEQSESPPSDEEEPPNSKRRGPVWPV